jgi:hypothetical protein
MTVGGEHQCLIVELDSTNSNSINKLGILGDGIFLNGSNFKVKFPIVLVSWLDPPK